MSEVAAQEKSSSDGVPDPGRDFVKSLERGLTVIRAFGSDQQAMTLVEVARSTGLTRAAARRFLITLTSLRYMETDGRYFWLSPRVLELGYAYLSGLSWPDVALPHVERLVAEVEDASEVGILDETEVVFILRVPGPQLVNVAINIGARLPAHVTALGKVMLAALPPEALDEYFATAKLEQVAPRSIVDPDALRAEIDAARTNGWAVCDQELEEGLRAIAVPLHDRDGRVIAALNLSSHVVRRSVDALKKELLPALQATASQVEAEIRVSPHAARRPRI